MPTQAARRLQVICGALDLTSKTARQVMTPLHNVFMLSSEALLDKPTLLAIVRSGHSRIPVYRGAHAATRCL